MGKDKVPEMRVITRFPSARNVSMPGRVYVFESGFESAYKGNVEEAVLHYERVLNKIDNKRQIDFPYVNSIMWGEGDSRMIDFFGYTLPDGWNSNPDVTSWVTKGLSFVEGDSNPLRIITCARGIRILGEEEKYRLQTQNLRDYIENPPQIPGLFFKHAPLDSKSVGDIVRTLWQR